MDYFKQFDTRFKEVFDGTYEFIDEMDCGRNPLNLVLIQDNDEVSHDSYGYENSRLERIFQTPDFGDIYIKFYGTRCSYQGEDWDGYVETKPIIKTITKFE